MRCIAPLLAVTRLFYKTPYEVRCEDLIFRMQAPVSHVHITSGHDRTHHPMKSQPYSHRTSDRVLLKSRVTASNGAIQRTCARALYHGPVALYSYAIQLRYTAYSLDTPNLDPPPFDTGRPLSSNRLCPLSSMHRLQKARHNRSGSPRSGCIRALVGRR